MSTSVYLEPKEDCIGSVAPSAPPRPRQGGRGKLSLAGRWLLAGLALWLTGQSPARAELPLRLSSYLGGSDHDTIQAVTVDSQGNTYVAGSTSSANFPLTNGFDHAVDSLDAFVTKIGTNGQIVFSTLLGGSGLESALGIAIDAASNVYVTGVNGSGYDFPFTNGFKAAPNGVGLFGFVAKIGNRGTNLIYSSYLSGPNGFDPAEEGRAIAVDAAGYAYIAGFTKSTNLHLVSPIQAANGGDLDAFVMKVHPAGTSVVFSTYLGGLDDDQAYGIAVDAASNIVIVGDTQGGFPITNAFDSTYGAGNYDGFVAKIAASGTSILWSTFYGGASEDHLTDVALDTFGNAYFTGYGQSFDLPLTNAIQTTFGGYAWDAYIAALGSFGSSLAFSTFYGGDATDYARDIEVDAAGNIVVVGDSESSNLPVIRGRPDAGGYNDAFVLKLLAGGRRILYSSYLGGGDEDYAYGVAVQRNGIAHIGGETLSTNFPVTNAFQSVHASPLNSDAFIARIENEPVMLIVSNGPAGFVGGWNTYSGAVYQAQASTNLLTGTWTNLGGPVTALVGACCATVTQAPPASIQFLRAVRTADAP